MNYPDYRSQEISEYRNSLLKVLHEKNSPRDTRRARMELTALERGITVSELEEFIQKNGYRIVNERIFYRKNVMPWESYQKSVGKNEVPEHYDFDMLKRSEHILSAQ